VEISAINLGQTELIINRTKDVERRNVNYGLKHSFVHVSVYSSDVWYKIALCLGYTFAFFSLFGFSPQVALNQYRKSVAGFNLAFLIMEVMDTSIYLTYTLGIFYGTSIREQYLDRNETQVFPVAWYDVMFSIVTMTVFILLVAQYIYFGDGDKNVTVPSKIWISLVITIIAILFILAISNVISWFDMFMYVPWVRLLIAIFKYVPQIITNYALKSISGLSIFMVVLEFIVGFAIVGQMTIDVINFDDVSLLLGNFSKFFDGFCTFIGNAVFILQFIFWHKGQSSKKQFLVFRRQFSQFGIDKNDGLSNKEEYININQLEQDDKGHLKDTEENESSNLIDFQNMRNSLYS
jgi:cystinosin